MDAHGQARDQAPTGAPRRENTEHARSEPEAAPGLPGYALAGLAVAPAGSVTVHRSLQVGSSDDPAEVEAERTAETIVRLLRGAAARPAPGAADAGPRPDLVRTLRRMAARVGAAGGAVDEATGQSIARLRGGGSALPSTVRRTMESAFGEDLSDVRIHTGSEAERLNTAVSATAFTVGSDIVFRSGLPDIGSESGQRLLAHELTHVLQQREAPVISALRALSSATGLEEGGEPSARTTRPAAGRTVRRVLVEADGEPADVENLIRSYPQQAEEIRARHEDPHHRYHPSAVSADAPLTFAPVGLPSANRLVEQSPASGSGLSRDEREEGKERKADTVLGPSATSVSPVSSGPSDAFRQFLRSLRDRQGDPVPGAGGAGA